MGRGATAAGSGQVEIVIDEHEAVQRALDESGKGDLLVLLVDDIDAAVEQLQGRSSRAALAIGS